MLLVGDGFARAPGAKYQATPCKVAPNIDGTDGPGEWDDAKSYEIDLEMSTVQGEAGPPRRCELRLMNSATQLYLAFSVPDAARDFEVSPLVTDLVILAFCRGEELAEGDDRRLVLPGMYGDKHVVSPGKDEDDDQRDGKGAMRWSGGDGGKYFVEWQIALDAKDKNDISVAPGEVLRFNLVFGDRFSPSAEETELGGLFGPDTDHAKDWGTLALAGDVGTEAPAAAPEWLASLFPHTGQPDRLAQRLRRLDANEFDVQGQLAGSVIVELKYPGLDGQDETGQARIFLPPHLRDEPSRRVPLIHNAGYEIDVAGAAGLVAKGYAVSTVHAHPLNPLGRGVNLDRAILHAVRRLPCMDPLRVSIQGGSAGGWMTLMLTADSFPLVWATPDVPPIHWGYNAAYIAKHESMAGPPDGSKEPRLPVLLAVAPIAEQSRKLYGLPFDNEALLGVSPLAHLDTITAATLVTFSTADMLVPVDQVGAELVMPFDSSAFPDGFSTKMTDNFPGVGGRRTLLAALPAERYELFRIPTSENPTRLGSDGASQGAAIPAKLPFSKDKTWSIVILDEGAVEPTVGHFKYAWALDHEPFRKWAEQRGVTPDQLTSLKLERLMRRLRGESWRPFSVRPGGKNDLIAANQLDYPEAERADVLLGLAAFAANDACATRLTEYYARLPDEWKVLGPGLGDGTPSGARAALDEFTASPR